MDPTVEAPPWLLHCALTDTVTACGCRANPETSVPPGSHWRRAPRALCCPSCELRLEEYRLHRFN